MTNKLSIRELTEKKEYEILSKYATKSDSSLGRDFPEEPDSIRTCFAKDKDKIIHSHALRREKDKTQVFILPQNDHIMNRLTHTLEVVQVAETIAKALNLNMELAQAIAFGHDTAHTCFGHAGERALDRISKNGYNHALEAERRLNVISGLNLTKEVIDGIKNHSGISNTPKALTLEGQIIPFADKIAYLTSDMENAISMGIIKDIPEEVKIHLGKTKSEIMTTLITSIINASYDNDKIVMEDDIFKYFIKFREFNFNEIYFSDVLMEENKKGDFIIEYLYNFYLKHPEKIHYNEKENGDLERYIVDYIAGMTDKYALNKFMNFSNH
jgi:dGTPase